LNTSGPAHRFRFALFVETEGFDSLLAASRVAGRFDAAIMSTEGMSVTAARRLVERLSEEGVIILVLRDFDKSGFSIAHTPSTDTRRYKFRVRPTVIDIGLRLADVRTMGVATKPVACKSRGDPGENVRARGGDGGGVRLPGPRRRAGQLARREVELKAMTSPQFVGFIERKFAEHGVGKVVPTGEALATAFRRAVRIREAQDAI